MFFVDGFSIFIFAPGVYLLCFKGLLSKIRFKEPFLSFTKLSKVLLLAEEPYPAIGKRLLFSNIRLKFNL